MADDTANDADIIAEARKAFERCSDAEQDNRETGLESLEFARLGKQWPSDIRAQRESERRPVLTINKMNAFLRQVVNDARQNKPAIKVNPSDDKADIETAHVLSGLIRNIENQSTADIAYDTAIENATSYWVGYIRVDIDYADEDGFDFDLKINRVINPASVYGDPDATSADGSDWNVCFVTDALPKAEYERKYGDKAQTGFDDTAWDGLEAPWRTDDHVMIAEWWTREPYQKRVMLLDTGITVDEERLADEDMLEVAALIEAGEIQIVKERMVTAYRVRQRIISGVEVLEDNEWPGKFIPIIPVYGDEFNVEGKRYIRSLVHDAMDAQRMFNYWRTTATELVALAPRVPFIGKEGFADADPEGWASANTVSHAYLEYKGNDAPIRQPLDTGAAAGALQEALNASDDMKAILGIYDASLGARSNETSGRAIMARQQEGDVATFHFIDNLSRSIRHVGRILVDLIPYVYSERRIIRTLGEDGTPEDVPMGQERVIERPGEDPITAIHDLTVGKYDVTVSTGPSYTTRRVENAYNMVEFARAVPQAGSIMIDKIAKAQDWEGADEIAARAKSLMPRADNEIPPQVQEALQQGQMAAQELEQLKTDKSIEFEKLQIERYKAETDRMKAEADMAKAGATIDKTYSDIRNGAKAGRSNSPD